MILPPILDRELRVAARRRSTYSMRFFAALITALIWYFLLVGTKEAWTRLGSHIFLALSVLALGGCLFSGMFLTADCLVQEKRDGTLGLIFLANLRGSHVVLGKLAATSLTSIFGLLAILPIIGLSLLIGGVTGNEFGRLMLVLITTLFWSLSIGLAASAVSTEARHGMGRCLLALVFLSGILPALWWCCKVIGMSQPPTVLLWPSPCYALARMFESAFATRTGPLQFWRCLGVMGATGVLALTFAMIWLPRSWQNVLAGRVPGKRFQFWKGSFRVLQKPLLDLNPLFWLTVRDGRSGVIAQRLLLGLGVVWFGLLVACASMSRKAEGPFVVAFFLLYGMHAVAKMIVATEATRRMYEDRASGALELLLVTPLETQAIIKGQSQGLKAQFRKPLQLLALMNLGMVLMVLLYPKQLEMRGKDQAIFAELFLGGILTLIADFWALCWAGMAAGLTSTKHFRAVLRTLGKIMLPPWLAIFLMFFLQRGFNNETQAAVMFGVYFGFSLVLAVAIGTRARRTLRNSFRKLAFASGQ
ncbi:MAG TPA: hypothetical protein VMZ27_16220 [Candidatus Saccharimonadales bacterium]|nr:hypothetical protein [Candidatus Saccharimonadales bacterium]